MQRSTIKLPLQCSITRNHEVGIAALLLPEGIENPKQKAVPQTFFKSQEINYKFLQVFTSMYLFKVRFTNLGQISHPEKSKNSSYH